MHLTRPLQFSEAQRVPEATAISGQVMASVRRIWILRPSGRKLGFNALYYEHLFLYSFALSMNNICSADRDLGRE